MTVPRWLPADGNEGTTAARLRSSRYGWEGARVRFLCTFAGGTGHLEPTLPVARALRERGHEVAYACQPDLLPSVARAGFPAYDTGGATVLPVDRRRPLVPVDRAAEEDVVRRAYAGSVARERAARLRELAAAWRPDVVVWDELDFGAAVAAEALGVPHAAVIVIAAGGLVRPDVVGDALDALRSEHGLPPDAGMLHRHLTVVPVPPSYRDPRDPLPGRTVHVRPAGWTADRQRGPLVLVTLGTVFAQESGDLFARLLMGVRDLAVDVLVTIGPALDPSELGAQPSHVRVERFVPLAEVLPRCSAVVSHGGSGTVVAALAAGVPSVLLPMGAYQPLNADRCVALGVGRALDPMTATAGEVRDALHAVLHEPGYRAAAQALRTEVAGLPGPERAAKLLEQLGARACA
jgi:UDP:flavonoid glycosyltransferase YjiC (YdhE family)